MNQPKPRRAWWFQFESPERPTDTGTVFVKPSKGGEGGDGPGEDRDNPKKPRR